MEQGGEKLNGGYKKGGGVIPGGYRQMIHTRHNLTRMNEHSETMALKVWAYSRRYGGR